MLLSGFTGKNRARMRMRMRARVGVKERVTPTTSLKIFSEYFPKKFIFALKAKI